MRILHIIHRYSPAIGGSEDWCRNICRFSVSKGAVVNVASINLLSGSVEPDIENRYNRFGKYDYDEGVFIKRYPPWNSVLGWKIVNFMLYKIKLEKTDIGTIFKHSFHSFEMYSNLINEIKNTDIVHLHTLPYFHNTVGFYISKFFRKKIIITPHFHPEHAHYELELLYRMMNKCQAVVVMSNYEKNHLVKKGVASKKVHVVGNFACAEEKYGGREELDKFRMDLFRKYDIDKHSKIIIFIGRKERHKGIDLLIEAAKGIVREDGITLCLFLVGPNPNGESNIDYSKLSDSERLKIIDFGLVSEEEKINLLRVSGLLVLPSKFEAFGIVFLEAWKYAKPVIGSDKGAIPEIIQDAGLCFRYGNIDDLKEKIKKVLYDEELSKKLAQAGRKKLEEYSFERVGNKIHNIYNIIRKNKKILVVSHLFSPYDIGGSEVVALRQSRMLNKSGFDIEIFAGKIDDTTKRYAIVKEKRELGITRINLHQIDLDNNYYTNFDKEELREKFCKVLYETAPDLVHFHNIYGLSLRIIEDCRKRHIPTIMTLHDYWGICFKNIFVTDEGSICQKNEVQCLDCHEHFFDNNGGLVSLSERNKIFIKYLNMVNLLISPSNYLIRRFVGCGLMESKTLVVNNGIDIARFGNIRKSKSKKIRFGYIGQISHHKGIYNLLVSMSLLNREEREKISLMLVGGGENIFVEYCKNANRELKLTDFVVFMGKVKNANIKRILSDIDVLIVPSIWPENSPVTIMEALASGTPVLASDVGGIPELIEDGVNGFLHKHDDSISLTENIRKIIRQPNLIRDMRDACLERVRPFDLTNQVKIIADRYRQLIGCP